MTDKARTETHSHSPWTFRYEVTPADREAVRRIVASTGFFNPAEVEIAVELVDERLAEGPASGYHFVFAERDGQTHGYACYGHISGTATTRRSLSRPFEVTGRCPSCGGR
jgi:hypothetical protein